MDNKRGVDHGAVNEHQQSGIEVKGTRLYIPDPVTIRRKADRDRYDLVHNKRATTLDRYGHVNEDMKRDAANRRKRLLGNIKIL